MGKTINKFVAEPYTTRFGDTINPGDRVAYVTHSHRVYMGRGWFDGVFKDSKGNVVFTRVRGICTTKSVPTGKMVTHTYMGHEYDRETRSYKQVEKSYEYAERVDIPCEPYGTALLQHHRMIKIEG